VGFIELEALDEAALGGVPGPDDVVFPDLIEEHVGIEGDVALHLGLVAVAVPAMLLHDGKDLGEIVNGVGAQRRYGNEKRGESEEACHREE
jgi:hypothetical protein